MFDQDIISFGKFYYKTNDKMYLNYTVPRPYLIVINGNKSIKKYVLKYDIYFDKKDLS